MSNCETTKTAYLTPGIVIGEWNAQRIRFKGNSYRSVYTFHKMFTLIKLEDVCLEDLHGKTVILATPEACEFFRFSKPCYTFWNWRSGDLEIRLCSALESEYLTPKSGWKGPVRFYRFWRTLVERLCQEDSKKTFEKISLGNG